MWNHYFKWQTIGNYLREMNKNDRFESDGAEWKKGTCLKCQCIRSLCVMCWMYSKCNFYKETVRWKFCWNCGLVPLIKICICDCMWRWYFYNRVEQKINWIADEKLMIYFDVWPAISHRLTYQPLTSSLQFSADLLSAHEIRFIKINVLLNPKKP